MITPLTTAGLEAVDPETVVVTTSGPDAGTVWIRRGDRRWSSVRAVALCVGPGQGIPSVVLARWSPVLLHSPGLIPSHHPANLYNERWPAADREAAR